MGNDAGPSGKARADAPNPKITIVVSSSPKKVKKGSPFEGLAYCRGELMGGQRYSFN